jgi:hypothetical protein
MLPTTARHPARIRTIATTATATRTVSVSGLVTGWLALSVYSAPSCHPFNTVSIASLVGT